MGVLDTFFSSMSTDDERKTGDHSGYYTDRYSLYLERLSEPFLKDIVENSYTGKEYREAMTRLDKEIHDLENHDENGMRKGYYSLMMLVSDIANEHVYPYYFRDKETGTLIAYLLGMTGINPLSTEAGGCDIPYKGNGVKSLEISVVPALLYIIPNAIKQIKGISVISERIQPNSVRLKLKLENNKETFKLTFISCDTLVDMWQKEHMELGEYFEDIQWGKIDDADIFSMAANILLNDNKRWEYHSDSVQKMENALQSGTPTTFVELVKFIQEAYSSDDYKWPRKPAAEIARIYCILATAEKNIAAA